jgi:hypothetical protein
MSILKYLVDAMLPARCVQGTLTDIRTMTVMSNMI